MLLGRDREQLALVRLLEDARAGDSGVLAIVGEAGIGKSALLAYAEEQANGMNVLRARGVQSEAHIPFAGLFELLRPALAWLGQIPGPQAAALESALALRPASAQDRFAVGAATLSLLATYAERAPVAVLRRRRALAGRVERGCPALRVPPPPRRSGRCRSYRARGRAVAARRRRPGDAATPGPGPGLGS